MGRPALDAPRPELKQIPGRRKWYIRWTADGKSHTRSTGRENKDAAECVLADFIAKMAIPDSERCASLINAYLKDRKGRVKCYQRLVDASKPLKAHMGSTTPQDAEIVAQDYEKRRGGSNGTRRRELGMMNSVFKFAEKKGYIQKAPKLTLPPKTAPRDRYLTRKQGQALLAAAHAQHLHLFILIALTTGARKTSILELTWDRVDFDRGRIDFNEPGRDLTKKRRTVVPVSKEVVAALRDAQAIAETDRVIEFHGKPIADLKHGFHTTAKKAGVPWCTPHHLKHSVVSWLAEDGYSEETIADVTATDTETIKRIYRKVSPEYLEGVAESLAANLFFSTPLRKTIGKD